MQHNFSAEKGLHTDTEPVQQPAGTYRRLVNGLRTLSGAIQNEPGTDLVLDLGKPVLATHVVDQQVAIFSGTGGDSEIGWLREDDTYQRLLASEELAFSLDQRLSVKSKLNFKGEQVLYFTDGTATGLRFLNTQQVPQGTNVGDRLRLQAYAKFPIPELVEVAEGGAVSTGVYQFAARLLTASGNPTSYGLITSPIPVTNEGKTDPTQFDGAPPQTPATKSIVLDFGNVDASYKLLEVVMLTYLGTTNTQVAYVVGQVPIQGREVVRFTYTGESQHKEQVDLAQLSISGVVIESAKHLEEKQGVLVASNLTFSQLDKDVNWQFLASFVDVGYSIKEVSTREIGGYQQEKIAAEFKSLRRGEAYALAFAPIFRAYQDRSAYHIPAPVRTLYGNAPADTINRTPGTYQSQLVYPTGLGYPEEFGAQTPVRHHIMPTLQQEPFLTADGGAIRILGLKLDFTRVLSQLPEQVRKELVGFAILRQPRTAENSTVLTQGIAQAHVVRNNVSYLMPFAGKYPFSNGDVGGPDYTQLGFLSPESAIYNQLFSEATQLQQVAELTGEQVVVEEERGKSVGDNRVYLKLDYTRVSAGNQVRYPLLPAQTFQVPATVEGSNFTDGRLPVPSTTNAQVSTYRSYSYQYLRTSTPVAFNNELTNGQAESYYDERSGTDEFFLNGQSRTVGTSKRYLFNLLRPLSSQYGNPTEATYYRVGFIEQTGEVYNGDTFIGKVALLHASALVRSVVNVDSPYADFRTLSYFWCESSINTHYRHYVEPVGKEGEVGFVPGTTPYYPKMQRLWSEDSNVPGLFNLSPALGHARGYNKQYSFSDNLLAYYPKGYLDEQLTSFPNRSVYTPVSLEGEQLDTWRLFLPTDYHDIPRTFGPITDTFVLGNTFYHHTPGALFRSFTGEAQTLNTEDSTQIYLSSGIFFGRPSEPVLTVDGGYAGTQGKWGLTTPQGRYFVDAIQNKLWLFNGKLNDLSKQGMLGWSEQNVTASQDTNQQGYRLAYDYRQERLLFTRLGAYTYSYSLNFNSWTGEHSYLPTNIFSKGKKLYLLEGGAIHLQQAAGKYGEFLNKATTPFLLQWVVNEAPKNDKKFDALLLTEEVRTSDGQQKHQQSVSTVQFWNDRKNTGELTVVVPTSYLDKFQTRSVFRVQGNRTHEHTNISIPSDVVLDPNQDVLDPQNLGLDRSFSPRMSGLFCHVQLTYTNQYRYTLQGATVLCRPILR